MIALEMACRSHPGLVRAVNQDSVCAVPRLGLALLADGLGGYRAGEVAAEMATRGLRRALAADRRAARGAWPAALHALLRQRVGEISGAIHHQAQHSMDHAGMGTTLVLALFSGNTLTSAHVGDSRLYRLRADCFEQLTRDHSLLQEQIEAGLVLPEHARLSVDRNLVTRALGVGARVNVDVADHRVEPGDVYLLCSDGLTDMVPDDAIRAILLPPGIHLEQAADTLLTTANRNGGRDNVSLILVRAYDGARRSGLPIWSWMNRWRFRNRAWRS